MTEFCLHPNKKWGQNFLADANIVRKIIAELDLKPDDFIVEIGPGLGVLTMPLVKEAQEVIAIEIDRGLIRFLNRMFSPFENITLIEGDIRKTNIKDLCTSVWGPENRTIKLVGNLPYYISSPFIYELLAGSFFWYKAIIMVQKEVAERIIAPVSTPLYGSLSVLSQCFLDLEIAFNVSPNVFYPAPQVESAVLVMQPKTTAPDVGDKSLYIRLIAEVFKYRRKTLLNSLSHGFGYEKTYAASLLKEVRINPEQRPESLTYAEFANLCRLIYNNSSA